MGSNQRFLKKYLELYTLLYADLERGSVVATSMPVNGKFIMTYIHMYIYDDDNIRIHNTDILYSTGNIAVRALGKNHLKLFLLFLFNHKKL